jgi:hypothetical protein
MIFGFSQSNNYANGNGTIIETKIDGNIKWVFRKHIQRIQIGDLSRDVDLNIYDKPTVENTNAIGKLKLNDYVKITQIAEGNISNNYYYWLNISTDNNIYGWIFCGKYDNTYAQFMVPYFNNRWEIIDDIRIYNKKWTIRKMIAQMVSVWEVLNIRDKPGLIDTKVISKIIPPKDRSPQINLLVTEATEEKETIDGLTDRWLKINYQGVEGWIFGGYASVERGGIKYYIPEGIIDSKLGWY